MVIGVAVAQAEEQGFVTLGRPSRLNDAVVALNAVAVVVGATSSFVVWQRWRFSGDFASTVILSLLTVLTTMVLLPQSISALGDELVDALAAGTAIVTLALALTLAIGPEVISHLRPRHVLGSSFAASAALSVLAWLLFTRAGQYPGSGQAFLALGWTLAAFFVGTRGLRHSRPRLLWMTLLFIGLSGHTIAVGRSEAGDLALVSSTAVRLIGLVAFLGATIHEVIGLLKAQRMQTFLALHETTRTIDRMIEQTRMQRAITHDASAAILAIESGLRHVTSDISDDLLPALQAELRRLQATISEKGRHEHSAPFDVSEILGPMVAVYALGGNSVTLESVQEATVFGRAGDTAEVVQNLIDNALRHGDGPVQVWVSSTGPEVQIRVADRGDGVADSEKSAIFEEGSRGSTTQAPGSGIGLHLARQLVEAQSGSLTVDDRAGGGALFVVTLPAASAQQGGRDAPERSIEI